MRLRSDLNEGYQEWKISPMYEVFYIECIRSASLKAIESWETLNKIVSDEELLKERGLDTVDLSENIVNQAGLISKYFFPPRIQGSKNLIHRMRGEKLRISYQITDNNILKNREFRDFIEHFDEKLDVFLNSNIAGLLIPPKTIYWELKDIDDATFIFKAYIVKEFKLISLNKEIYLVPLIQELYRIYNVCVDYMENGGRLK